MPARKAKSVKSTLGKTLLRHQNRERQALFHQNNEKSDTFSSILSNLNDQNKSNTQTSSNLENFLEKAVLAEDNFNNHRTVKVVSSDFSESFSRDITDQEAAETKESLFQFTHLPIPRRPEWKNKISTKKELNELENYNFLNWRRKIAKLEETNKNLVVTPFEKNIEFWKQLWRVVEKSDVIVQVVDARNPLLFRCEDLEKYVNGVALYQNKTKRKLLLINKADFLTDELRESWKLYFSENEIEFVFFSAKSEQVLIDKGETEIQSIHPESNSVDTFVSSTNILTRSELLMVLASIGKQAVEVQSRDNNMECVIGMVGFPNVGKSSCINVLLGVGKNDHGLNRVSVAATPGHTKHFQTLDITNLCQALLGSSQKDAQNDSWKYTLCDCPGLVFPTFMATKADLYLNGILPIDEMRAVEYMYPLKILCSVIPRRTLETVYSLSSKPIIGPRYINPVKFIELFCEAKKLFGSGRGRLNEAQGAKYILKDFVAGKILYCKEPPGSPSVYESDKISETNKPKLINRSNETPKNPLVDDFSLSNLLTEEMEKLNMKEAEQVNLKKEHSRRTKHKRGKNRNNGNPYASESDIFMGAYVLNRKEKGKRGENIKYTRREHTWEQK